MKIPLLSRLMMLVPNFIPIRYNKFRKIIKVFSPPRNVRKLMVLPVQKMMDIISIS